MPVTVVGGGLAGCEAAWQLACRGIQVRLVEMKPLVFSPAHVSPDLAELVCSNSLRSGALESAAGLLKEELRLLGSLIMEAADRTRVPAGKALAVDRNLFSAHVTERITSHPLITMERRELASVPGSEQGPVIIATGPLTSEALAADISRLLGARGLHFYDAIAPIVTAESLDMDRLFSASRYEDGEGDYLNSAMDEPTYRMFVTRIVEAEKMAPHPFEEIPHFEGCLPVEELARRGPETLAFGPMKPVGLVDPVTGKRPYAVVQLRAENKEQTLYNLVGFQTKMTHPEQEKVFRLIPGLENAEFARLGSIHRNTYVDAPRLLDRHCRSVRWPHIFFAGQITGVEGYIESTASGLVVGLLAGLLMLGGDAEPPPSTTAVGGLLKHNRNTHAARYEPMNVNFGLLDPAPAGVPKKLRKQAVSQQALEAIAQWRQHTDELFAGLLQDSRVL